MSTRQPPIKYKYQTTGCYKASCYKIFRGDTNHWQIMITMVLCVFSFISALFIPSGIISIIWRYLTRLTEYIFKEFYISEH